MKKGIIVCIKDDHCIVALKNGEFRQISLKKGMKIGDSTIIFDRKSCIIYLTLFAFFFSFACSTFVVAKKMHSTPTGYISIDINPGIEFTINRFGKVLSVNATNEAAKTIIAGEDFINKHIEKSVERIIEIATALGFLSVNPPTVNQLDNFDLNFIMLCAVDQNREKTKSLNNRIKNEIRDFSIKNGMFCVVLDKQETFDGEQSTDITKGKAELLNVAFNGNQSQIETHKDSSVKQLCGVILKNHKLAKFDEEPYLIKKDRVIDFNAGQLLSFKQTLTNDRIVELNIANNSFEEQLFLPKKPMVMQDWEKIKTDWFLRLAA